MNNNPDIALVVAALALIGVLATAFVAAYNARRRGELDDKLTAVKARLDAGHSQELKRIEFEQSKQLKEIESRLAELGAAEQRRRDREQIVARYREPLARAAYDLQSRLFNILQQRFIDVYLVHGTERESAYALHNTVFVIAQYFAWTEIVRRDLQHIDLGTDTQTSELARLQDDIYSLWQTDALGPRMRVFAGEQRAIGESLVRDSARGVECIGYGAFLAQLQGAPAPRNPLLENLRDDVAALAERLPEARARLVSLQNAMVDLLAFVDPAFVRFPAARRSKVAG